MDMTSDSTDIFKSRSRTRVPSFCRSVLRRSLITFAGSEGGIDSYGAVWDSDWLRLASLSGTPFHQSSCNVYISWAARHKSQSHEPLCIKIATYHSLAKPSLRSMGMSDNICYGKLAARFETVSEFLRGLSLWGSFGVHLGFIWGSFGVGVANLLWIRIMLGKRCGCSQTSLFTGPYAQIKYKIGSNQTSKTTLFQDFLSEVNSLNTY